MSTSKEKERANTKSFERMVDSDPVLIDICKAGDVVPNMAPNTILTSGPPMPWESYFGGQRDAIIGAALFEGLGDSREEVEQKLGNKEISVAGCHDYGCVGSLAGVYSASMSVFVVENQKFGNRGFCNLYEGTNPRRLNYGIYDEGVKERLRFVENTIVPVIRHAVLKTEGIELKPLIVRALHMGDELHSRNTAASLLFTRELFPHLLDYENRDLISAALKAITEDNYFFLRLSMAAAKVMADASHGIEQSSVVTAMAFNCCNFAIRVSGLGSQWILGPHADVEARLFDGHTQDEISWMGGESTITETVGLGGFAQAAAFPLQKYQGGSAEEMVRRNVELYEITIGEHNVFHIPYLGYRGTPTGIDIFKVKETGIRPVMDIGIAGRDGGQIGAGIVSAPMSIFNEACELYNQKYQT